MLGRLLNDHNLKNFEPEAEPGLTENGVLPFPGDLNKVKTLGSLVGNGIMHSLFAD